MVSLDPDVMDVVEANPAEWVVRLEGSWSRRGLTAPSTPRWYFQKGGTSGNWWYITELPFSTTRWTGTSRWDLEPYVQDPPIPGGALVHVTCAPPFVQLWVAGFRADLEYHDELRAEGAQQDLSGWS